MLLLALIAGASAYLYSRQQTPVYEARQNVLIEPTRADLGLAEAANRLLNPLVVVVDSNQRAEEIINSLELDMTPGGLLGVTQFNPDQLRRTIQISVESTDPQLAAEVANAWGQILVSYRDERNARARREDRVEAILPDQPRIAQVAPRPLFTGAAGAIAGLLVGAVIVFVLEYLEYGVIRRREDAERVLDRPVLAAIPHDR
jgi:capsular polysaccharide biosynthesis protein